MVPNDGRRRGANVSLPPTAISCDHDCESDMVVPKREGGAEQRLLTCGDGDLP
jgi:hypothetical protein